MPGTTQVSPPTNKKKATSFFCRACLYDKPIREQSSNHRYCLGCYTFMQEDAKRDSESGEPSPATKPPRDKAQRATRRDKINLPPTPSPVILSQPKIDGRGRKKKELPDDIILRLAGQGLSCRLIATRLKEEYGTLASYRTIARIMVKQQGVLV